MTFGSLFAGIGGFDLGLERAGMECRWQVEIDDYASRVLAKHWPHVQRWGDVRTFPPGPADEWRVDLICAGVPGQPVSHAGKQKGVDDERWMWGEALRVVADIQPAFFVAENPIGILNHDGGRAFRGVLGALSSVGYVCEWHVIAASDLGAPHRRERVWLVAHADSLSCTEGQSRRAARGLPTASAGSQGREDQGETWSVFRCIREDDGSRKEVSGWWNAEPKVGRLAHGIPDRVDRLRCLGNAVVPQVVEIIGRAIMQSEGVAP